MSKHIRGNAYEVNAKNMNEIIAQLDEANDKLNRCKNVLNALRVGLIARNPELYESLTKFLEEIE